MDRQPAPSRWLRYVVVALTVGVFVAQFATRDDGHAWYTDASQYTMHAENLASGRPYAATGVIESEESLRPLAYPPGYPLLLAPIVAVSGRARAPIAALHALCIALIAGLAGVLYWRRLAPPLVIALVLLIGFSPFVSYQLNRGISDLPFTAFVMLALVFIVRVHGAPEDRRRYGWALAAGLAGAAALLTRSLGVVLPLAFLWPLLRRDIRPAWRPTLFATAVVFLVAGAVYGLGDWEAGGRVLGSDRAGAGYEDLVVHTFAERVGRLPEHVADRVVQYATMDTRVLWSPVSMEHRAVHYPLRLLASLVLLVGLWRAVRRPRAAEAFAALYLLALLPWTFGWARYLLPVVPFLTAAVLVGAETTWRWSRTQPWAVRLGPSVALAATFVVLAAFLFTGLSRMYDRAVEGHTPDSPDGSELIQAHTPPDATVLTTEADYVLAFKTGRTISLAPRDTTAWPAYVQRLGAEYAVWTGGLSTSAAWAERFGWHLVAANEAARLYRTESTGASAASPPRGP